MTKKKTDKRISAVEPVFDNILVCRERKSRPFLEILIQEPENISTQNLGTLMGVFEVTETSEDSSYIVNYLISVIKKEYFSKPKRGPVESLEAALHRANLALSKLAEHGNISWLGKLNVLVAVIEKNNLHLTQTGTATAFLLRAKTLTDVSEGLAPEEAEPYPLKTFVNVSCGKLEIGDKVLITTDSIFSIFSSEEIKKSALRFSSQDFTRFLKTALSNELEKAAVLIFDVQEKEEVAQIQTRKSDQELNAFSQASFAKKSASQADKEKISQEINLEIREAKAEFVDEKTGHIYIKENNDTPLAQNDSRYVEALSDFFSFSSRKITGFGKIFGRKIINIRLPKIPRIKARAKKIEDPREIYAQKTATGSAAKKISAAFSAEKISRAYFLSKAGAQKIMPLFSRIVPSFSKIKNNVSGMSYQQKLYVLLAIILIFVAPIFIIRAQNKIQAEKNRLLAAQNKPAALPLEQDKNVTRLENTNTVYSGSDISGVISLNGKMFVAGATEIIDLEKNKAFSFPPDFGAPILVTGMDDLNLIFILNKDNRIISFSPISGSFQDNSITIPADANIRAVGTYLTYIYLVDSKNNQLYRYPRAEGGFGEKVDWLKDATDISKAVDLAMNENIFLTDGSAITKLFKGKKQDFNMEESSTPIEIKKIALGQSGNIYILDSQNARVIHLDGDNKIMAQYYNIALHDANSFATDEANNQVYFSNTSNVQTFNLN